MATSSTMIDKAILKVNNRSRMNAGKGSTIIDRIIRISIGPANTCHCVSLKLPGKRSRAAKLAISVTFSSKIQCFRHR
ncbi:hypothetical protein D3C86_2056430 [compost metagenome]